jgi:hypothetical protein
MPVQKPTIKNCNGSGDEGFEPDPTLPVQLGQSANLGLYSINASDRLQPKQFSAVECSTVPVQHAPLLQIAPTHFGVK